MIIYWDTLEKSAIDPARISDYMMSDYVPLVKKTGAQTLEDKTLAYPVINDGVFTGGGALSSKLITATRVLSAANGDVAYTGVGFQPTAIVATGCIQAELSFAIGISDSAKAGRSIGQYGDNSMTSANFAIQIDSSGGNFARATLKTFDNDGFTLTWAKTGSPTGTAHLGFLCFR